MKKLDYRWMRSQTGLALLCILMIACKKSDQETQKMIQGTLVKTSYNRSSVFRNPLNGWVMYASRTDNDTYWDRELYVPDLGKRIKVIDYASACYVRTSWASLNPAAGVYAWRDTNSQLGRLIKGARDRGVPIAFRIVVDGRDQGMNTPKFVFDAGARSYVENSSFPDRITPLPQDPVFRQYYSRFIEELAKDFNDPQLTSFIDAYGLGKWGEAHNVIYGDPNNPGGQNTEASKEEVMDWISDLYGRTFSKVPLVINYHRVIGDPVSWGASNPNTDRLLAKLINKGYSLRQDAFGMTDYYQSWEKQFAKTWNYKRPIIMEGGWITTGTHRYWTDPSGKYREGHPEDVRLGEFDASAEAHVNMMDFRVAGETDSWFEKSFSLVQRFVSEGGYRLYPDQIYVPETISSGGEATISHRWRNMGWGYFPNNIPQWNFKYKVAFALLDDNNNVKQLFTDEQCEPSSWLKNSPTAYELKAKVNVPTGKYSWAVAIVDSTKDNQPGISLSVNGDITATGWLKLIGITVH